MSTLSGILSNFVERLLFRPVTVISVESVGGRFRLLRMHGEGFKNAKWKPGQTVQIFLGNLTKRAYTPMDLDPIAGSACFLFYLHDGGPGSRWAASVKPGDECQVMHPKDSLDFRNFTTPTLFFGDETSFAAAQALSRCDRPGAASYFVLEVERPAEAEMVLRRLGVKEVVLIEKQEGGTHLPQVAAKLTERAVNMRSLQWVFTGEAHSIQSILKRLKHDRVALPKIKVKAYWSLGKTGMD